MWQLYYISVLQQKIPSSFLWLGVYVDNRSSGEQNSIFNHQYLLELHNLDKINSHVEFKWALLFLALT